MRILNQEIDSSTLQRITPSVFAQHAKADVSDRYSFLPTSHVVDGLRAAGWAPVWATEQRVRTAERRGFQKHMLRFRRFDDLALTSPDVGAVFPELVLVNSHDRSSAYQLHAGLFRLVCSNGMIVADTTFDRISVKHINFNPQDVIEASFKILNAVPDLINNVNEMRAIELSDSERVAFAESALIVKFDDIDAAPMRAEKLLAPRRYEDNKKDLWTTLNAVQENIVRGGIRDRMKVNEQGQSFRRTTAIKSIDENVKVNKALWHLAEKLKEMRAA